MQPLVQAASVEMVEARERLQLTSLAKVLHAYDARLALRRSEGFSGYNMDGQTVNDNFACWLDSRTGLGSLIFHRTPYGLLHHMPLPCILIGMSFLPLLSALSKQMKECWIHV